MDFSEYTVWLLKTALAYWIVFAIIMPFFLAGELIYMNSKKKMTKKENGEWQQINNIPFIHYTPHTPRCQTSKGKQEHIRRYAPANLILIANCRQQVRQG